MEKKRILSLLLVTSLVASTTTNAFSWPWSQPTKSFTEKMFDGVCSMFQAGENAITNEYDMLKQNMPNFIRNAAYRTLAGIAASAILTHVVFKPCSKIASYFSNFFSSDPKVSVSKKGLAALLEQNKQLKVALLKALMEAKQKKEEKEKSPTAPGNDSTKN